MAKDFTEWHENMIKQNTTRSLQNEQDIETLEKVDIGLVARLDNMCKNVNSLTKVLWALASAIFVTLVAEIAKSFL